MLCTFVQTHRAHDSKSDTNINSQLWVTPPCWWRLTDRHRGTSGGWWGHGAVSRGAGDSLNLPVIVP